MSALGAMVRLRLGWRVCVCEGGAALGTEMRLAMVWAHWLPFALAAVGRRMELRPLPMSALTWT